MTTLQPSGGGSIPPTLPSLTGEKKEEGFKNTQITYELYPTLKIKTEEFLNFEDIVSALEKGRSKARDTSKLRVKGMSLDDLPDYFNRIKDKIKDFIDSINQKIIDNKLSVEYTESNASKTEQKDKIIEEHQGLIDQKINDQLVKSFKKKMRNQPNCNDPKKFRKGVKIEGEMKNSGELNKKIYSELEKCFDFLTRLLQEYCTAMGWTNVSISKDILFKKDETQKPNTQQQTQPYQLRQQQQQTQQQTQPYQLQQQQQTQPYQLQQQQQQQQYQQQYQQQRQTQQQPQSSQDRINQMMTRMQLSRGGSLKSNKNSKKKSKKNSKKQKRILTKKLSRKSSSRYMIVSKKK